MAAAKQHGWRAIELSRGSFNVIEFWMENRVMLELMTPEMTKAYLLATTRGQQTSRVESFSIVS